MFGKECDVYYEKGLSVIPAGLDKKVIIDNFASYSFQLPTENTVDYFKKRYSNKNIGLMLGPINNLIAIDIDTDKPDVIKFVEDNTDSTIKKIGKKGMTLFFKYKFNKGYKAHTWLISKEYSCMLEVLVSGRYTLIPPSIHPETKKEYRWVGGSLINNYESIPEITDKQLKKIEQFMRDKYDCLDFTEIKKKAI